MEKIQHVGKIENAGSAPKRKTDRRTLYTRKVVMDAYVQLLREKPKEKIRVTELCAAAEINRCTFYLHFEDVASVEAAIMQELYQEFKAFVSTQTGEDANRLKQSDAFLEKIYSNDTYVTILSVNKIHSPVYSPLAQLGNDFYREALDTSLQPDNALTNWQKDILYDFILGGISAVQMRWIEHGTKHLREDNQFLDQIVQLLTNMILDNK